MSGNAGGVVCVQTGVVVRMTSTLRLRVDDESRHKKRVLTPRISLLRAAL
jgi:hypothetical protein